MQTETATSADLSQVPFANPRLSYSVVYEGRQYFPMMARTGRKVHIGVSGSSVALCGWWHRGHEHNVRGEINCEHCLDASYPYRLKIAELIKAVVQVPARAKRTDKGCAFCGGTVRGMGRSGQLVCFDHFQTVQER